jgi:hypothetical protein
MDEKTLEAAIQRLQDAHDIGRQLDGMVELGAGGKQAKDGQLEKAMKVIRKQWRREIGPEQARKMISFSKRYSEKQLQAFLGQCLKHGHAPEFGLVIRLLPVKHKKLRNKLQLAAIRNAWSKQNLEAELQRQKPKRQLLDTKGRGRKPKAVSSREALLGEASVDAVKWVRILNHFEQGNPVWDSLSKTQKRDFEELGRILKNIAASRS